MSSLRMQAPRTFADENAVLHDRTNAKQSGATTRRGLGAGAPLKPTSTPPAATAQPLKPTKAKVSTAADTTGTRRALGDITNAKKAATQPITLSSKPHQPTHKQLTATASASASAATASVTRPTSPLPIERPLGLTWREQEERAMDELTTRRDSLTGLTPTELASSIRQLLNTSQQRHCTTHDERPMAGWEVAGLDSGVGMADGGGVEVDERKLQALLDMDVDIDFDL